MKLTGPQIDAVLAGLRLLQREMSQDDGLDDDITDVWNNMGQHVGLEMHEIDELCEKVNV